MRTLILLLLTGATLGAQSLTLPLSPERVLDTVAVFGYPLSIVQPVEADGYLVTEEFLLRDDLRGDQSTNLYYLVALHPDGIYCSPGFHPDVMRPPAFRPPLRVWLIQGIHKLIADGNRGSVAQYALPTARDRCP